MVVTYNALPWLERCLDSVARYETIVVDNGSTDGTVELVRERFHDARLVEQPNLGLAAGWNRGIESASGRLVLLLNADAWAVGDAVQTLVTFAEAHPKAAVVAPKLLNPDGSLQRSVRGFPTLWRLATEYYFLRKLAPHSRTVNAFYAGDFDHAETREVEWVMGASLLVRRDAIDEVGSADSAFFLFSEETDWCYRFCQAGWSMVFHPGAEVVHVSGAAHGGRMFKGTCGATCGSSPSITGRARPTARGASCSGRYGCAGSCSAAIVGACTATPRRGLPPAPRPSSSPSLVDLPRLTRALALGAARAARARPRPRVPGDGAGLYLRLAAATLCLLVPGALVARALGQQTVFAALSWSLAGLTAASAMLFAVEGPLWWALALYAGTGAVALPFAVMRPLRRPSPFALGVLAAGRVRHRALGNRRAARRRRALPPRPHPEAGGLRQPRARVGKRVRRRWAASRLRVPAVARPHGPRGMARRSRPGCRASP